MAKETTDLRKVLLVDSYVLLFCGAIQLAQILAQVANGGFNYNSYEGLDLNLARFLVSLILVANVGEIFVSAFMGVQGFNVAHGLMKSDPAFGKLLILNIVLIGIVFVDLAGNVAITGNADPAKLITLVCIVLMGCVFFQMRSCFKKLEK